jgi:hypothetical protein
MYSVPGVSQRDGSRGPAHLEEGDDARAETRRLDIVTVQSQVTVRAVESQIVTAQQIRLRAVDCRPRF